jgi:hypothetical protein
MLPCLAQQLATGFAGVLPALRLSERGLRCTAMLVVHYWEKSTKEQGRCFMEALLDQECAKR